MRRLPDIFATEEIVVDGDGVLGSWGRWHDTIMLWGEVLGRQHPQPVRKSGCVAQLSAPFVEWMMGLPEGWASEELDNTPAMRVVGNGVVPLQAARGIAHGKQSVLPLGAPRRTDSLGVATGLGEA